MAPTLKKKVASSSTTDRLPGIGKVIKRKGGVRTKKKVRFASSRPYDSDYDPAYDPDYITDDDEFAFMDVDEAEHGEPGDMEELVDGKIKVTKGMGVKDDDEILKSVKSSDDYKVIWRARRYNWTVIWNSAENNSKYHTSSIMDCDERLNDKVPVGPKSRDRLVPCLVGSFTASGKRITGDEKQPHFHLSCTCPVCMKRREGHALQAKAIEEDRKIYEDMKIKEDLKHIHGGADLVPHNDKEHVEGRRIEEEWMIKEDLEHIHGGADSVAHNGKRHEEGNVLGDGTEE